jgi:toxin CcdB
LETVIVAPVVAERPASAIARLNPAITLEGKRYRVLMQEMAGVPRSRLGEAVGNCARQHAEFIAAVDLLFSGF